MGRAAQVGVAAMIAAVLAVGPVAADEGDWEASSAGWSRGPVEHVDTVQEETGTAVDAVLRDDHLYVTAWRSFSIYDVSDPLDPQRLSTTPLLGGIYNEEPQTNGDILLISRDIQYLPRVDFVEDPPEGAGGAVLDVYDVTDKENPERIAIYESTQRDHLWACVHDCAYAYSASGTILDLRDPTDPTVVGDWSEQAPYTEQSFHHVAEVAPGIVMTGSLPMYLLDAREDATAPEVLATTDPPTTAPTLGFMDESLPARVAWPGATRNRFALVSMETPFTTRCDDDSGEFLTFDTTGWKASGAFTHVDTYEIGENGTFTDGRPPANVFGCTSYGLDPHPGFGQSGGLAAVTFFEHGMRLLDVDHRGRISEVAGFLPLAGNSARPVWVTDELVYVIDLHRGIDILRIG